MFGKFRSSGFAFSQCKHEIRQIFAHSLRKWQMTKASDSVVGAALEFVYDFLSQHHKISYSGYLSYRARRLPQIPVISVGNVAWGGTGKTPFVESLLRILRDKYKGAVTPLVLSRGDSVTRDESAMLKEIAPFAKILQGKDRFRAATNYLQRERFATKTSTKSEKYFAIVDDGLQHISLQRDVNIIMVNALSPFGVNGHLIPRGTLRESFKDAVERACGQGPCFIVLHHADLISSERVDEIECNLTAILRRVSKYQNSKKPAVVLTCMQPHEIWTPSTKARNCSKSNASTWLRGKNITLLSGVECPQSFEMNVRRCGANITATYEYADHYHFTKQDLHKVAEDCLRNNSRVLVTHKDYARCKKLLHIALRPDLFNVLTSQLRFIRGEEKIQEAIEDLFIQYYVRTEKQATLTER